MELIIPPLVVPCVTMFATLVGLELVKAPSVKASLYVVLISLKSVDTLAMLAEIPAVDSYCISFAMIGNADRLLTLE